MIRYDTIVIGAGLAGLTTACQLARQNQKVMLFAQGQGALLLSSGAIDVLGFQPAESKEPVQNPLAALDDFLADNPNHPYKFTGETNLKAGLNDFLELVNSDGKMNYLGSPDRNWLLPGTLGAVHPTCLAPASMVNGDLGKKGQMLIVGFNELRDFYPALTAENLTAQNLGVQAEALMIDAPAPLTGRMNITPLELATAFELPDFQRGVVESLKNAAKKVDRIGFPAVLGLDDHPAVLKSLVNALGKPVFEISTLPPSVPGRRLCNRLKDLFLQAGGRITIGAKVVDGTIEAGRVTQIRVETASRLKPFRAENYVLATGGLFSGGLVAEMDGTVRETIFNLPVVSDSNRHTWFAPKFLQSTGQPVTHFGVAVNERMNPVDSAGNAVAQNLYPAGTSIAGASWLNGRAGHGVALATSTAVVRQITSQTQEKAK